MFVENHYCIEEMICKLNVKISELPDLNYLDYKLVITGSIGCGKSSICELLKIVLEKISNYNIVCYPEYIIADNKKALQMLNDRINNKISPFIFQNYILDVWESLFKSNEQKKNNKSISIFERTPQDSVECFGYIDRSENKLTQQEFDSLLDRCNDLYFKYSFPLISPNVRKLIIINSYATMMNDIINRILSIISKDIRQGIRNRIVYIHSDVFTAHNRIQCRARRGEEKYSIDTLSKYHKRYLDLFRQNR